MIELTSKIDEISKITDHYLVKAKSINSSYFNEFLEAAAILKTLLTKKEFEFWCTEKMLLKPSPFAGKAFIQNAVETSVVRFFGEKFPANFKVEVKVNPHNDKNVDCQFLDNGYKFNIEVKCSDFVSKEEIDNTDAFKFGTIGRLQDRGEKVFKTISSALDVGLAQKGEPLKLHLRLRKMDNNLKDFLESAHEKFNPVPNESEVNILIVGCDDCMDVQDWMNYLWAPRGLFTEYSFSDFTKYSNVDMVVLTNQYFKHNKFYDKRVIDCWSIEEGFNLISSNPRRLKSKEVAMKHFIKLMPNFSKKLEEYKVPGNLANDIANPSKVIDFIKENLEAKQNKYLFEEKTGAV